MTACSSEPSQTLGGGQADASDGADASNTADASTNADAGSIDQGPNDASTADAGFEGPTLWKGQGPFEATMLGRMTLRPPHRQRNLDADLLSVLPLTVYAPVGATGPLPVVIYSHGGGSRTSPGESGETWASQLAPGGYAVLAMHHMARSREDMVRNICSPRGVSENDCDPAVWVPVYESTDRPQDASFVIDQLAVIGTEMGVELDASRVAVLGHSGGTNSPLYMAGGERNAAPPNAPIIVHATHPDPRPVAFVASSPPGGGGAGWFAQDLAEIERPMLSVTGSGDLEPELGATLFDDLGPGSKYRLFINSPMLNHGAYNMTGVMAATGQQAELFALFTATVLAFLDAHVRGDTQALSWLQAGTPGTLMGDIVADGVVPGWSSK